MTNKQQYVERKKYKKEQIYDAIAKRIREIFLSLYDGLFRS